MPEPISWRMHWRLIVAAAILAALCWGGVLLNGQSRSAGVSPVIILPPLVLASPTLAP